MSSPFQQPAQQGDKVPMPELPGSLVLIKVTDYRTGIVTANGEKDAVACDVHVLDGKHGGEVFDNALLFQGALIGALKPAIGGGPVLGRISLGTAKPSQNAPYILLPFTDADAAIAGPYWASVQAKGFQAPRPPVPDAAASAAAAQAAEVQRQATQLAAPASGVTAAAFAALPENVKELLRQSGQAPAA